MLLENNPDPDISMDATTWFKEKATSLQAENESLRRELAEQKQAINSLEARMKAFEDIYASKEQNILSLIQGCAAELQSNSPGSATSHPNPMKWTTFVKFMVGKGFTIKDATSSVTFTPPNPNFLPITVDKPQPDLILTPMMLSTIADTLEKSYGWNAGNFVMQANAATAAEGRVMSVKALEDAPISKLQRSELSARAKEFLNCGMDPGVQPKPMKWATFIGVMGELGFERHDTAGSSVRFDHANPTAHPIAIHKPHPDSTLTPMMMFKIVKRLRRYYGPNQEVLFSDAVKGSSAKPAALDEYQPPAPPNLEVPNPAKKVEDEDADAGGSSGAAKKNKKKKNKKNKKEAGEEGATPASPTAATPLMPSFHIPVGTTEAQSSHSYLKEIKQSEKTKQTEEQKGGLFSKAETALGGKADETNNAKYTWFSRLSKKATDSMHQLLRTDEDAGKQPAPMKWETFVKLMKEMGFEHDPNTSGSTARFEPPNGRDHPISIHKPHPDSTLTPIMLIKIGKRMKRYYGWNEDQFIAQTRAALAAEGSANYGINTLGDTARHTQSQANAKTHHLPMEWDTFVKFMVGKGFQYDPSAAGSNVRFDPPNLSDKPITIHKPHPNSTLTPFMLVKIAMRLKRFYGWTEENFVTEANAAVLAAGSAVKVGAREDMFASSDAFQQSVVQWLTVGAELNAASKGNVSYAPLKWETFVGLMTGMGFEVDQTHSASVRFMPPSPEDHTITLHRPYPDDILTPMALIKIGKRLQRYYNWDEEEFATKAKTAAAADLESCE